MGIGWHADEWGMFEMQALHGLLKLISTPPPESSTG